MGRDGTGRDGTGQEEWRINGWVLQSCKTWTLGGECVVFCPFSFNVFPFSRDIFSFSLKYLFKRFSEEWRLNWWVLQSCKTWTPGGEWDKREDRPN